MFQTLHEISKNLIFVFVWKYVWKYVNINVSDIKKKKNIKQGTVIGIAEIIRLYSQGRSH